MRIHKILYSMPVTQGRLFCLCAPKGRTMLVGYLPANQGMKLQSLEALKLKLHGDDLQSEKDK